MTYNLKKIGNTVINRTRHIKLTDGYMMAENEPLACPTGGIRFTKIHVLNECRPY